MSNETAYKIFLVSLAIGAVLLGLSVLVAAINLGGAIVSGVMVVIFQVIVTVAAIVLIAAVAGAIASAIYSGLVSRMSALERSYGELLRKLNKRAPTFATSAALVATLVLLLADKSFKGETIPTICVGIVLVLLFWLANELLVDETRLRNILGVGLWATGLVFLPVAIYFHRSRNMEVILQDISGLGIATISLLGLTFLVACFAPVVLKGNG